MLFRLSFDVLIILIPVLLFSLCFHEFAHAYVAYLLGDSTAQKEGRLTLDPRAHLDLTGSLMILFVGFGWAKPVPVNTYHFSHPRKDMMKVAFAGPASNLLLALIAGIMIRGMNHFGTYPSEAILQIIYFAMLVNVQLALFNLIPVAPLDGSQIFGGIISKNHPDLAWKLQTYGPRVLLAIILIGYITPFSIIGMLLGPFVRFFLRLFAGI
jgi:Zn-dependent protease